MRTKKTFDKQKTSEDLKQQATSDLNDIYGIAAQAEQRFEKSFDKFSKCSQHDQTGIEPQHHQTEITKNEETTAESESENTFTSSSMSDEEQCLGDVLDIGAESEESAAIQNQKVSSQKVSHTTDTSKPPITLAQVKPDEPETVLPTPENLKKVSQAKGDVFPVTPSSNPYILTRKSSMLYLTSYSQNLTPDELFQLYHSKKKKTIAEIEALTVLVGVVKKDPEERKRYWDIEKKIANQAAKKNAQNTEKSAESSLFDDAMAEINDIIEGETVDTGNRP